MSFDTPLAIAGPLRRPRQMLADQAYDGHSSIHDDAMATQLGFRAGPIEGPTHFSGTEIVCPPALRPAVVILLAMLASKGTSVLRSTYVIHRGYEDLAERLNELGANIEPFRDI